MAAGRLSPGQPKRPTRRRVFMLSIASLGVVFGDIGTSPLYAVRETFSGHFGVAPTPDNVLGILSLITWSLVIIVSLKYVRLVTRADNGGEGGILALTALINPEGDASGPSKRGRGRARRGFIFVGLFGAALLFGDAILTPAISVLGGMEGLVVAAPGFDIWVVPLSVLVLVGLFLFQRKGTIGVGKLFAPITLVWFIVLAVLGIRGILLAPGILLAVNPFFAVMFLLNHGMVGVLALGAVFLVVTGAEALYADLGHFGRDPIRYAWFVLVFPSLLLNYFGQGALVLSDPTAVRSPFFLLAPADLRLPLTVLSVAAAVIASQAVISGVFSLCLQAVQLGYWPRLDIRHTSALQFGQIYVPPVNALLCVSTIAVVLAFRSSSALAAAYGVAIVSTMVVTTLLLFFVAPTRWGWSRARTALILSGFLIIELTFLAANVLKIHEGGWLPLAIATLLFTMALSWRRGRDYIGVRINRRLVPVSTLLERLDALKVVRVPGTAIYMTRDNQLAPNALMKTIEHQGSLHEKVILLTVLIERIPHVRGSYRIDVETLRDGFVRVTARYGFMDPPDIPSILEEARAEGLLVPLRNATFFLGRETLLMTKRRIRARVWAPLFSFLDRNSQRAWAFYRIPPERVVVIGSQFEI